MTEELQKSYTWGTGRRKTAVARVRLRKGTGKITVNKMELERYFLNKQERAAVLSPLRFTKVLNRYDILARVDGGGKSGQADAMLLGIARALVKTEPPLEEKLRAEGFLTRDPRMKERKKYGRRGARRSFQFSKR